MGLVCSRGPSANALPEPATPEPEPRGWQVHAAAAPRVDSGAPPTLQALCDASYDSVLLTEVASGNIVYTNAAFRALASGGERLRWEPFFFDWFCGGASESRALAGPRGDLYGSEAFLALRELFAGRTPDRPERLAHALFYRAEPEELLYDEIEAIWTPIAERDDWSAFHAKLAAIEVARQALALDA